MACQAPGFEMLAELAERKGARESYLCTKKKIEHMYKIVWQTLAKQLSKQRVHTLEKADLSCPSFDNKYSISKYY